MPHKMYKLLLIEDDESTIKTIETALSYDGWKAAVARTGEEALEKLNKIKPHLILLDLLLPQMDGFEVLRILRNQKKFTGPIVILSNLGTDGDIKRGLDLGANDYLVKGHTSIKNLLEFLAKYRR